MRLRQLFETRLETRLNQPEGLRKTEVDPGFGFSLLAQHTWPVTVAAEVYPQGKYNHTRL
jgi:hypothetical protein